MRDKRPVDELSIEELERILALRKREARMAHLRRYEGAGRIVGSSERTDAPSVVASGPQADSEGEPEPATPPVPAQPAIPVEYYEESPQFEDEFPVKRKNSPADKPSRSLASLLMNRFLLLIEFGAAAGLIYLFVNLFQTLQAASQTTANMQAQYQSTASARLIPPTPTPVINVSEIVLPVGHMVSVSNTGVVTASFNLDEVPAQYRTQYQVFLTQPEIQATPSPTEPVRIQIPKIRVDSAVVSGDNWQALSLGVGHHIGSADPGQQGNIVLSAHNDVYGETFRNLDQLQPGDQVMVSSIDRTYTYVVQGRQLVSPTDVWVMQSQGDARQLTLISCYPYQVDTKRIVVFATLQAAPNS